MRLVGATQHELRGGGGDRRAHVDEVELGVVAGDHPGSDVGPVLVGHVTPGLVPRLAWTGDEPPAPELRPGQGVVGGDDACLRSVPRTTASSRHDLAVGDDRARRVTGRVLRVVDDRRFPDELAGGGVQREDEIVVGRVDDEAVVDRDVAVDVGQAPEVLGDVVGHLASILPLQVTGDRVDRLHDVSGIRHVEHAVVGERCALLAARRQRPRPDESELADVVPRNLVERAVAPAVERPPPHEPVRRIRVLEHGVGDRHEVGRRLGERALEARCHEHYRDDKGQDAASVVRGSGHVRSPPRPGGSPGAYGATIP